MNWTQLNAILLNLAPTTAADAGFATELPDIINYAENRIYRDLDFLNTRLTQTGPNLVPGAVAVTITTGFPVVVLEGVNITVPLSPSGHQRHPLTRQTKPFMDLMYPIFGVVPSVPTIPVDFCDFNNEFIIVGPVPDAAYGTEFVGTYRPEQISGTNTTTWLCDNLPELYVAACMIRISGYQKNYAGATSDDPQQPVSWETQYGALLKGADTEEVRKKAQSGAWSDQKINPQSTPQRA